MPIYEYVCQSCGKKTEVLQRISEKPLKICPYCGGRLKKAASAPAIQFKGSGWYVTDYARAKKEEKAASAAKSETPASGASETSEKPADMKKEKPAETKKEKKAGD
jgi:putative FmdB family regulatory protein